MLKLQLLPLPQELLPFGKLCSPSAPPSQTRTASICFQPGKHGAHLVEAQVVLHSRGDVEDVAISSHGDDKSIECLKAKVQSRVTLPASIWLLEDEIPQLFLQHSGTGRDLPPQQRAPRRRTAPGNHARLSSEEFFVPSTSNDPSWTDHFLQTPHGSPLHCRAAPASGGAG